MAGYNWEQGKSNNAVAAEADGMVARSKITKAWLTAGGIDESAAFIKWLAKIGFILPTEWHHTSKVFNRTDYYSIEDIREALELRESTGQLAKLRELYKRPGMRRADRFEIIGAMNKL